MEEFEQAATQGELAALTARVFELEQAVTALRQAAVPSPARKAFIRDARPVAMAAAPPPPVPGVAEVPSRPAKSLEDRLGAQVFNMIGIVALIVGSAWALKLAIEHGYLGPVARVLIGIAAGVGLVLWSEVFRRKGLKAFSYSLKAVGSGVLYLTLWAGFQLYHLMPAGVALGLMVLVSAWNAFMAWTQDSELLAGYALFGGFATPLLLSTGGDHETFLFTYVAAIDVATVVLLRTKPWRLLLVPTFLATVAFSIGWYSEWFHRGAGLGWDGESTETVLFAGLFWLIFAVVTVRGWVGVEVPEEQMKARRGAVIPEVLLPLANAAFLTLTIYSVLQDSGEHPLLPWVMVTLAAVYLGLMQVQRDSVSRALHLAIAVILLTAAIPLKASGHTLTTAWLVEGLVLFWASTRFEVEERSAARVLWVLAAGGYLLGLGSLVEHWFFATALNEPTFLNRNLGASLVAIASLAGVVWLAVRERRPERGTDAMAAAGVVAIDGVAGLLCFREIGSGLTGEYGHTAFANAPFATGVVGLLVLAGSAWGSWKVWREDTRRFAVMQRLAAGTVIAFNLLTILCVEREIGALWHRNVDNVQRSLAISGFLMLYGAVLLAIGFWKRSAFTRWQALALLLFTICKVFLYDTSNLSAGYRVASFMGLGAVLMGVSLAYQKDWLGLKNPHADVAAPAEREA